jgi:hypothetical protein
VVVLVAIAALGAAAATRTIESRLVKG